MDECLSYLKNVFSKSLESSQVRHGRLYPGKLEVAI